MGKSYKYSDGTVPDICIIGAGYSGLTAGIQLKRELNLNSFTIFDENHDIGGTWLVNNYPGCACDVPSHLYSWSFELNPDWTETFSSSSEILTYMKRVVRKYELYGNIKLNTMVKSIIWNDSTLKWHVKTYNKVVKKEEERVFDIVMTGTGLLRTPKYPKEFETFKGTMIHSAEWDPTINLEDKIVGVVGSGSSAIQIIPSIASKVKELHCFQRKPAYVNERPQKTYSTLTKLLFRYIPPLMWFCRLFYFIYFELFRKFFDDGSWANNYGTTYSSKFLKQQIPDNEKLQKQLTPSFKYGCKRVLFHNDYYPTLNLSHVHLHTEKIIQIDGNKISCGDGTSQRIDVLILATGFEYRDYFDPLKVVGKDSIDVVQTWKENAPSGYLGIISNSMPNQFVLLGPTTALGHNSVVYMVECQVHFMITVLKEMMRRNAKCVLLKKETEDSYMEEVKSAMEKTVWVTGNCGSWYADTKGRITALWPYTCYEYWKRTKNVDFNHFEFF